MNNSLLLSEKEFEIINILADGFRSNQRELSNHIGLSLGMTNLLVRRLATKGYLRIKQMNRKKIEYLLTAQGMAEKARKSYNYTFKTIQSFGLIRSSIHRILTQNLRRETTKIVVSGTGDLADLAALIVKDFVADRFQFERALTSVPTQRHELVLDAAADPTAQTKADPARLHLLTALAENLNFAASKRPKELSLV